MTEPAARSRHLGVSGTLARKFLNNQITPLLALAALLLGAFAVLVTPREEEPQIDVTFANVLIAFPGASAQQVEALVASPMEKVLAEIAGLKHIYSVSHPGLAVLTVQFVVGEKRNDAIVRLYNAIYSNQDWRPANLGVLPPIVKPGSIDDVPILTLTLWTRDAARSAWDLGQVARAIEPEIQRVTGTRNVQTIGSPLHAVYVLLDPQRLAARGLTSGDVSGALLATNVVQHVGAQVSGNTLTPVQVGEYLATRDDVAGVVVGLSDGKPVYVADIADITTAAQPPDNYVWFSTGPAAAHTSAPVSHAPAVTISVSKKAGENAMDVATRVEQRIALLKDSYIPGGVQISVTRNYGVTANDKARKLIQKLMFATASVVLLVVLTMGRREALVVGTAVIVTLAATLFASWAWGFTINRVSLFALIFSIGILVDDAIVIVENIHRRMQMDQEDLDELIPHAVDEVGGPTILATFTVIAALLPMAFVSGLMGPYMSPIPINSSMGMLLSLAIALIFTPWMCRRLLSKPHATGEANNRPRKGAGRLPVWFERRLRPFLLGASGRRHRHQLYGAIALAIALTTGLAAVKWVVLKMLPFDNKSEFQVILNMPEGTTLENTARVLDQLGSVIEKVPEVTDYQAYAGTAAPINFNGLVRQYNQRQSPQLGDLQVNLTDKHHRKRQSHDIVRAIRPALAAIGRKFGASSVQVVEVPPGPPVLAPLVAEIYGGDQSIQRRVANALLAQFNQTPDIVDTDSTVSAPAARIVVDVDRSKAALAGVSLQQIAQVLSIANAGSDATYVRAGQEQQPIPVRLQLPVADRSNIAALLTLQVRGTDGALIPLSQFATVHSAAWDAPILHKDLLPVTYVTGDMAGRLDSPLYGMFELVSEIKRQPPGGAPIAQLFTEAPTDPVALAIKWDGEWQITYETFRDMGLAYAVGLVLIYLLVVAHFGSYTVPLIIMAPIPLTIIGVMPGHALLGAAFTATSMIGMIALAGIIVRNSILLVDFINAEIAAGTAFDDAVIRAGTARAKPIALTALAAMIGALFILDDPIFNGLAISLIFGIFVSTILTLFVIPILYYALLNRRHGPSLPVIGTSGLQP